MSFRRAVLSLISFVVLGVSMAAAQPAFQVADLNTTDTSLAPINFLDNLEPVAALGGEVFFRADDGLLGMELWKTDGTVAGTSLVKDICPGVCNSLPVSLTVSGGVLYFAADDGSHGRELWRSDGTAAGTWMVEDVFPGLPGGLTDTLHDAQGVLYFAADDGVAGLELWKSDGTAAGTGLVKDIRPGPANSDALPRASAGGRLLLSADDGVHGDEPWISDGTAAGTRLLGDLDPGRPPSTSFIFPFSRHGTRDRWLGTSDGRIFFVADSQPWVIGATDEEAIALIPPAGPRPIDPYGFVEAGPAVYLSTPTGLWKTDGTAAGTVLLKAFPIFHSDNRPTNLTRVGDRLFFAVDDVMHGLELWVSDGTEAGTSLVKDIVPGPAGSLLHGLSGFWEAAGDLLFLAGNPASGLDIWRSDGTEAGTVLVAGLPAGVTPSFITQGPPNPPLAYPPLLAIDGRLFFRANQPGELADLWVTDGTLDGTDRIDLPRLASAFSPRATPALARHGNRLLLQANDGVSGVEPWVTDGTLAGTLQLADVVPGPESSLLTAFQGPLRGRTFFGIMGDLWEEGALWQTDGAPMGTGPVDLGDVIVRRGLGMTPFRGSLFFTGLEGSQVSLYRLDPVSLEVQKAASLPGAAFADLWASAGENLFLGVLGFFPSPWTLWSSDGASASNLTVLQPIETNSVHPHPASGSAYLLVEGNSLSTMELWRSDGTPDGTIPLTQIATASEEDRLAVAKEIEPIGSWMFFLKDDGATGMELWKTDGTVAGTVLVKDIAPGPAGSHPRGLTRVGSTLFFAADDGVHGRELWRSDGTAAGTVLVADLVPGAGGSLPQALTAVGARLAFSAYDDTLGREPWVSDGTAAGTFLLEDLAPGAASSSPLGFAAAGPNVYFAANDNATGFELWAIPRSEVGPTFFDVPMSHWAWSWIEALAASGLTGGCRPDDFCPDQVLNRAQAAVLLVPASHGAMFSPPSASGTVFNDVPADHWAASWIEQLAADGVTGGCGNGNFCPDQSVTRAELAVLLLRARHGSSFVPPPATGTVFTDVPASHWAAAWIERLASEGISGGCEAGKFCPDRPVTRAEMAVFLVRAFGLAL